MAEARRDRGRLRLGSDAAIGGYNSYRVTHAVEAGDRHEAAEQARSTLLVPHDALCAARAHLPGFAVLAAGAQRALPGPPVELLHAHLLDQGSATARFADHQDPEEEAAPGQAADRRVLFTVVLLLEGSDTAMQIVGFDELAFAGAGSGFAFRSQLWHRTVRAAAGVRKAAFFFGQLL